MEKKMKKIFEYEELIKRCKKAGLKKADVLKMIEIQDAYMVELGIMEV